MTWRLGGAANTGSAKTKTWLATAAGAAALALTPPTASAAIMVGTATGVVEEGADLQGLFGSVGSVANRAFTVAFTYDIERGDFRSKDSSQDTIYGGSSYGPGHLGPVVDLTIEIDGFSEKIDHHGFSQLYIDSGGQLRITALELPGYSDEYLFFSSPFYVGPTFPDLESEYAWSGSCPSCGHFTLSDTTGKPTAYAVLNVTSISINAAAPATTVPEPSTWAMLIAGFGVAGTMLRRRRPFEAA